MPQRLKQKGNASALASPPPAWQDFINLGRKVARISQSLCAFFLLIAAALLLAIFASTMKANPSWHQLPFICQCFIWCLGIGCLLLYMSRPSSLGLGILGIIFSIFCIFFPLICALLSGFLGFSPRLLFVISFDTVLPDLGKYLLVISVLHLLIVNLYAIIHSRVLQAGVAMKSGDRLSPSMDSSFIPHCWEMHACPDAARNRCPNYQDKINCWKRTRGCLCDHMLTLYLFHGHFTEAENGLTSQQCEEKELAIATYPQRMRVERPRVWRDRWKFCHACSVFLEHQEIKYRRLNWIFAPISLALIAVLFPLFDDGWRILTHWLDHLSAHLVANGSLPEGLTSGTGFLYNGYEYVFLSVLALLLMSYVVEITDCCLVEWKW